MKKKNDTLMDDAFNDCVEMINKQGATLADCLAKYPDMKKSLEPALKAALAMHNGPIAAPDKTYRARVKERLVTKRVPGRKRAFTPGPFLYRLTAATVAFALVLGGVGYASTDSLPDSPLYPVKLLIEKIRLAVTTDNAAEVELHLQLAEERLAEADAMAEEGKTDEARQALNELNKEMREAYRLAGMTPGQNKEILLAKFAVISQRHMLVLEGVLDRAPDSAKPAIERAIENSQSGLDKASEAVMKDKKNTGDDDEETPDDETVTDGSGESATEGTGSDNGNGKGQGGNKSDKQNSGKGKNK